MQIGPISGGDPVRAPVSPYLPEYMHHNAPGAKYWGRLIERSRTSSLACSTGDELVARLHSLPAAWDGSLARPPGRLGRHLSAASQRPRAGRHCLALAISSAPRASGHGSRAVALIERCATRLATPGSKLAAPVRPTLKILVPADPDRALHAVAPRGRIALRPVAANARARRRIDLAPSPVSMTIEARSSTGRSGPACPSGGR